MPGQRRRATPGAGTLGPATSPPLPPHPPPPVAADTRDRRTTGDAQPCLPRRRNTRFPSIVRFCLPAAACSVRRGWRRKVAATRATAPQRRLSPAPRARVGSGQGGRAGGAHGAPASRTPRRRKTVPLTVPAARGAAEPGGSRALRPCPACHPAAGPPRSPPPLRAARRSAGAAAAACRPGPVRAGAGGAPWRSHPLRSHPATERKRLPGEGERLPGPPRQGRAAARSKPNGDALARA